MLFVPTVKIKLVILKKPLKNLMT